MLEATSSVDAHSSGEGARGAAILVTSMSPEDREAHRLAIDARSHRLVCRAFLPLLREIGEVTEIGDAASRLDEEAEQARRRGLAPIHVSFRPLDRVYASPRLPNVAFPLWDLPRIPDENLGDDPGSNWARAAARLSLVLCASDFTRDAFRRAAVRPPVATVRVPVDEGYFAITDWQRGGGGRVRVETRWLQPEAANRASSLREILLQPLLPAPAYGRIDRAVRGLERLLALGGQEPASWLWSPSLDLSGVVYTTFLDPFDPQANWQDLLSAFVLALAEEADATLAMIVVAPARRKAQARAIVARHCASLGVSHRCKVALVSGELSREALLDLTRLSTYYVSASRTAGCCLAAQEFLAAGRPVVAPAHSALGEILNFDVGFPVESYPEPASWPHDPPQRLRTTRHRIVWQSLQEQIWASYVAVRDEGFHAAMAERGRARMRSSASVEQVRPLLRRALAPLLDAQAAAR
jgi:glycosyltransferase involved in cell wall biosynthesis